MIAYVSQSAFWGLLISAVEVYKRECFGLPIGYRDRKGPGQRDIMHHGVRPRRGDRVRPPLGPRSQPWRPGAAAAPPALPFPLSAGVRRVAPESDSRAPPLPGPGLHTRGLFRLAAHIRGMLIAMLSS